MTLTPNETTWVIMIIPLVILLGWGTLLAWITIKAQHAKSMEEIKDDTKKIFVRLFLWFSNFCALAMLLFEFFSSAPINRRDVFLIVWSVTILFMSLVLRIISHMKEMLLLHKEHFKATQNLSALLKTLPCEKEDSKCPAIEKKSEA